MSRWRMFLLLGVVALLWRLVHLLALRELESFGVLGLDAEFYDRWARSLVAGEAQPREPFFQGPLYPYFLALLYKLSGGELIAAQLVQLLLGSCTAGLAGLLARENFGARAGWVAGMLYALYPYPIFLETHLVAAPLIAFLLTLGLWIATREGNRDWHWAGAGFLLGAAAVARGSLWLPLGVGALLLLRAGRRRALALALAGAVLATLPVTVRNLSMGQGLVAISGNGGINYYIGNHDGASGFYDNVEGVEFFQAGQPHDGGSIARARSESGDAELDAAGASRWWFGQALRWQLAHPASALALFGRKLFYLGIDTEIAQIENFDAARSESTLLRASPLRYGLLFALGLVGMFWAWRRGGRGRALLILVVATWLSVALFFVTGRFRVVIAPALLAFSALALVRLWEEVRRRRVGRVAIPLVAVVAMSVVSFRGTPASFRANSDSAMHYSRGVIAMQANDYASAVAHFERAVRSDAGNHFAWANLGFCQEQLGRSEEARRSYEASLQLVPGNLRVLEPLAKLLLRSGNGVAARPHLEQIVQQLPEDWLALAALADVQLESGDAELGRANWRRVLEGGAPEQLKAMARERLESSGGTESGSQ